MPRNKKEIINIEGVILLFFYTFLYQFMAQIVKQKLLSLFVILIGKIYATRDNLSFYEIKLTQKYGL